MELKLYFSVLRKSEVPMAAKRKSAKRRKASKRQLIHTGRDTRFVRRGTSGRFKESDDVGRSLRSDRQKKSRRKVRSGYGDKGDR